MQINEDLNKIFCDKNEKIIIKLFDLVEQNNLYIGDDFHFKLENYRNEITFLKKKRNI